MAGPIGAMKQGWDLIGKGLRVDPPGPASHFLGCTHDFQTIRVPGKVTPVTVVSYDLESFMKACVERYLELVPGSKLHKVPTPFLTCDEHDSFRAPLKDGQKWTQCPYCAIAAPPETFVSGDREKDIPSVEQARDRLIKVLEVLPKEEKSGFLAQDAAKVLMEILYGARMARYDLFACSMCSCRQDNKME